MRVALQPDGRCATPPLAETEVVRRRVDSDLAAHFCFSRPQCQEVVRARLARSLQLEFESAAVIRSHARNLAAFLDESNRPAALRLKFPKRRGALPTCESLRSETS